MKDECEMEAGTISRRVLSVVLLVVGFLLAMLAGPWFTGPQTHAIARGDEFQPVLEIHGPAPDAALAGKSAGGNGSMVDRVSSTPILLAGRELLVYDWNRPVTTAERGFPRDTPPRASANGNWITPINYAQGTLYYRVEIRGMPVPKQMRLQFCFWQYNNTRENCGTQRQLWGYPGTVVTWSLRVQDMWRKNGRSIDWRNRRQSNGVAIKNTSGIPVSNYGRWNWAGDDPNEWYPLNMRFTVVVVAKGSTFSGWQNYIP